MMLHQQVIRVAKQNEKKLAVIDRTLDRRVSYKRLLIGMLILVKKFHHYDPGFLGIMMPNSAGSVLTVLATLLGGRVPVMINYSTGAAANCDYAQKKCAFNTIITSRALCQKINCPHVEGMVYLEDVMTSVTVLDKVRAALKAGRSAESLLASIHQGDEDDTLLILFTSGSEKEPKGVQLTHRNISANYESLKKAYDFNGDDIFLANLPYFHVFGQTANLWVPLLRGHDPGHLRQPPRFQGDQRHRARGEGDADGGNADFFLGLPAQLHARRFRNGAHPAQRRRQVPGSPARRLFEKAQQDAARSLRRPPRPARASPSTPCPTTVPAASAAPWTGCRSGSSITKPAKPARSGRSARSWSRATT